MGMKQSKKNRSKTNSFQLLISSSEKIITTTYHPLTVQGSQVIQNIHLHVLTISYVLENFCKGALKLNDKLINQIYNCNEILGLYQSRKDLDEIFLGSVHQRATMINSNYLYIGQWNCGFQCGFGQLFLDNSIYYIGYFHLGKPFGHGRMVYDNGSFYEGEWFLEVPSGNGIFYTSNGDIEYVLKQQQIEDFLNEDPSIIMNGISNYYGETCNGKKCGYGFQEWVDGTNYVGEFENDMRNGLGKMQFANGESYFGQFRNNNFEGTGLYKWGKKQKFYFGRYYQNKMNGFGIWKYEEHHRYIGFYKNEKLSGRMIKFNQLHNQKYIEYWRNDVQMTQLEHEN